MGVVSSRYARVFVRKEPSRTRPICGAVCAVIATALLGAGRASAAAGPLPGPEVIPIPVAVLPGSGTFASGAQLELVVAPGDTAAAASAHELAELLSVPGQVALRVASGTAHDGAIVLQRAPRGGLGAEGYRLRVTPGRITIEAEGGAGWFYGGITLWQLMRPAAQPGATAVVDAQLIEDRPRLVWRGLMLDSARHFQSPAFIGRLLDWMALHKLNVLQWHLTDDQAWRIAIHRYPALTSVGAFRVPAGRAAARDIDPATGAPRLYGGFYTQEDVRAVVAHARRRHITIVPEIELPGHASAAIASYPMLGVRPGLVPQVPSDWGVFSHVYSPEESTLRFLENVLDEVLALFPGPYVHMGGDEVVTGEWQQSPQVATRLRELGLHSSADLHHYFAARIERFLRSRGRRAVGWDEILEPGLAQAAVVMSWRGTQGARAASALGHDVVLAPDPTLYFDHRQGTGPDEPPGRVAVVSLRDVYEFEPLPADLTEQQRGHILGLQANLWTEHVRTEARAAAMVFPRLAALAEVGWSPPERRSWPDFERRMAAELARYRTLGLPFDESLFAVTATVDYAADGHLATVTLARQGDFGVVRYTEDGSEPGASSPVYAAPLELTPGRQVRAASFAGTERLSATRSFATAAGLIGRRTSGELRLCTGAVALALEDDAPLAGPRAVFVLDIENPCWIYPSVDLTHVQSIAVAVGQVPFNFQIGADRAKIRFAQPLTPYGELEVHLDSCGGELYARLPLQPASASDAVTVLPAQSVEVRPGSHSLCLRFAQQQLDPLWALDWVELRSVAAVRAAAVTGQARP